MTDKLTITITGPQGSGKTSLASALVRELLGHGIAVHVGGVADLNGANLAVLRRYIDGPVAVVEG